MGRRGAKRRVSQPVTAVDAKRLVTHAVKQMQQEQRATPTRGRKLSPQYAYGNGSSSDNRDQDGKQQRAL